jgi:hypothetical protein
MKLELYYWTVAAYKRKSATKSEISHPGMMGDGSEEQNLNDGNQAARIKKDEVEAAFDKKPASRMSEPAKVTYEVVEHDGGWAYRAKGVFSETFPTHALGMKRRYEPPANSY